MFWYLSILTEITKGNQRREHSYSKISDDQAQVYSEIDGDRYDDVEDGDSIGVEENSAYKPIDELLCLSQNRSGETHVPVSQVYVNESIVDTPIAGEDVEEEVERVESRVEEEEEDVTYCTPMNAGEAEENKMSVQSRAVLKEAEHDTMNGAEAALLQAFQGLR